MADSNNQDSIDVYLKSPLKGSTNSQKEASIITTSPQKRTVISQKLSQQQLRSIESKNDLRGGNESKIGLRRSVENTSPSMYQQILQKQKILDIESPQHEVYRGFTGSNSKIGQGGDKSRSSQFNVTGTAFSPFVGNKDNSSQYHKNQATLSYGSAKAIKNTAQSQKRKNMMIAVSSTPVGGSSNQAQIVKSSLNNMQTILEQTNNRSPSNFNNAGNIPFQQFQNAQSTMSMQTNRNKKKNSDDLAHLMEGQETLEQLKNKYHHGNLKPKKLKQIINPLPQLPADFKLQGIPANINSQFSLNTSGFQFQVANNHDDKSFPYLQFQNMASNVAKENKVQSPSPQQVHGLKVIPEMDSIENQIKKQERPRIHLPSPNYGKGAKNMTQYMQMTQDSIMTQKQEDDDYMPIDQFQKVMRETETLMMKTDREMGSFVESSQVIQFGTPDKISGSPSYQQFGMLRNPYKNIQKSENQQSTGIIKAPIYFKETKKQLQSSNKKLVPLQIVTSDFDPHHLDISMPYYGGHHALTTTQQQYDASVTQLYGGHSSSAAIEQSHCGFMFQSPTPPPIKINKEQAKALKQQNIGMKKNLKLIKIEKQREINDLKFQKIYDKLKINLEPIKELQQSQLSLLTQDAKEAAANQQLSLNNSIMENNSQEQKMRDMYLIQLQNQNLHSRKTTAFAQNSSKMNKKTIDEYQTHLRQSPLTNKNHGTAQQAILLLKHWQGTIKDSPKYVRNDAYEGSFLSESKTSYNQALPPIVSPASMRSQQMGNNEGANTSIVQNNSILISQQFSPQIFIVNHSGVSDRENVNTTLKLSNNPQKQMRQQQLFDDHLSAKQVRSPHQQQMLVNQLTGVQREQGLYSQMVQSEMMSSKGKEEMEVQRANKNQSYISNHHVLNKQSRLLYNPDVLNIIKQNNSNQHDSNNLQNSIMSSLNRQRNSVGTGINGAFFKGSRNAFNSLNGTQEGTRQQRGQGTTSPTIFLPLNVSSPHYYVRQDVTVTTQNLKSHQGPNKAAQYLKKLPQLDLDPSKAYNQVLSP